MTNCSQSSLSSAICGAEVGDAAGDALAQPDDALVGRAA